MTDVTQGVDYSTSRPNPAGLWAAGKRFVVRYGGPGGSDKHLTAPELKGLLAAGLSVVSNAEGTSGGFRGTATGRAYAAQAQADFRALGMPATRPIYFSADWDVQPSEYADVDAALRGAASVLGGTHLVGIYGGYNIVAHCAAAKTAAWFWQAFAWSGGRWHPAANMRQTRNGVPVAGGDCDLDEAMTTDYGQWGQEIDMPLTPDDAKLVVDTLLARVLPFPYDAEHPTRTIADLIRYIPSKDVIDAQLRPDFAGILEAVAAQPTVDVAALGAAVTAGVLAALTPEVLATLPADFAENVATAVLDGLSRRLAA
jgi:Rv2525c-like, glycoside hydrolase-like domain